MFLDENVLDKYKEECIKLWKMKQEEQKEEEFVLSLYP